MIFEHENIQPVWVNEPIEDRITRYTKFFDDNWQRLQQTLMELGLEPDNQILKTRTRSLTTILQLTTITVDSLREQLRKAALH